MENHSLASMKDLNSLNQTHGLSSTKTVVIHLRSNIALDL